MKEFMKRKKLVIFLATLCTIALMVGAGVLAAEQYNDGKVELFSFAGFEESPDAEDTTIVKETLVSTSGDEEQDEELANQIAKLIGISVEEAREKVANLPATIRERTFRPVYKSDEKILSKYGAELESEIIRQGK